MTLDDVLGALAAAIYRAGGRAQWAQQHGVSRSFVSAVLCRTRAPSDKILAALGLERTVSYRRIKR